VWALDVADVFVRHAWEMEAQQPLGIRYLVASAVKVPFADASFDFATGFMSFMDVPETERVLAEAYRVLKPGGFLQFSIQRRAAAGHGRPAQVPDAALHAHPQPVAEPADRAGLLAGTRAGAAPQR